jgi:TRAP-type C4-dicarboxylate transport system permease small subunit
MKHRIIIDKLLGGLVTILMGVLVLNVLWQVASRFIFMHPSSFTDELAGYLLIWVGLMGAAYATGQKQHLAIDLLSAKLSDHNKKIQSTTINVLIAIFALVILIGGGSNLVYISFHLDQVSSALRIPIGYVYMVLPLSGIFIIYYVLNDIYLTWKYQAENKEIINQ